MSVISHAAPEPQNAIKHKLVTLPQRHTMPIAAYQMHCNVRHSIGNDEGVW
jgi:hypothetical protein